jgi:nucleoside 2-deoxyribosyltransferase
MDKSLIFVFVVMPFSDEFKNIYDFSIKEVCKEVGVFCQRLDEQIFQESMLNQIYKADFIIADMSERNPNVFYEVGYAHAKDKNVILITKR